jgi:AAA family ATP:ADP antiporter
MSAAAPSSSPSPLRRALPFATLLFLLVAAHSMLETARDGMFLMEQPIDRLPWLYLAVTAAVLILTPLQRRLWGPRSRTALPWTLLAAGTVTLAFWLFAGARSTVLVFYVWTALFSSLVFVQFWLAADEAFSVDEAKRMFGFLAAGGLLGAVLGAGTARLALGFTAPQTLLILSAGLTFVGALMGVVSVRLNCRGHAAEPELMAARAMPSYVKHDPYLRLLAVLALLTAASATFIDYLFKASIAAGSSGMGIPRLVANVYLGQSVLALVVELGVVGLVLRSTGVTRSLAVLPLIVLGGAAGFALGGGMLVLLVLKTLDGGIRPSLYRVGTELLFLPIAPAERRLVKPSIDTLGQRGGQAVASFALLGLALVPARHQLAAVSLGLAVVSVAWVQASRLIRRHYLLRFQRELGEGRVSSRGIEQLDLASAEVLVAALGSSNTRTVVTALDVLAASERLGLIPALILYHPDPFVVRTALRLLSSVRRPDVDALLPYLLRHADDEVRAIAAERWSKGGHSPETLRTVLEDSSPKVRASALVALSATEPGDGETWKALSTIASGPALEARRALAWAIGNAPRADLIPLVEILFETGDVETRRHLLHGAGGLPAPPPELVSRMITFLVDPALRPEVRDALVAWGTPALTELRRDLLSADTPFTIARELPATIARFPADAAVRPLVERLLQPRGGLDRFRSLRALNQLRRANPRLGLDSAALETAFEVELRSVFRNRLLRQAAVKLGVGEREGREPAATLLIDLLRDRERRGIERTFRVLNLLLPEAAIDQVYLGIRSDEQRRRDAAREVLIEVLRVRWREPVLAMLDPEQVIPDLTTGVVNGPLTPESFVSALLDQSSEVVRLLTPCLAREEGWTGVVPRLRAGPRCSDEESAAVAAGAIQQLERTEEQQHA